MATRTGTQRDTEPVVCAADVRKYSTVLLPICHGWNGQLYLERVRQGDAFDDRMLGQRLAVGQSQESITRNLRDAGKKCVECVSFPGRIRVRRYNCDGPVDKYKTSSRCIAGGKHAGSFDSSVCNIEDWRTRACWWCA
jgi:hypothetical protein